MNCRKAAGNALLPFHYETPSDYESPSQPALLKAAEVEELEKTVRVVDRNSTATLWRLSDERTLVRRMQKSSILLACPACLLIEAQKEVGLLTSRISTASISGQGHGRAFFMRFLQAKPIQEDWSAARILATIKRDSGPLARNPFPTQSVNKSACWKLAVAW